MEQIRWGILGTGAVAAEFARGLRALPEADLYAVASRTKNGAETFARAHKISRSYGSYLECVTDPKIDIVYIATPNHRHYEDMLLCLQHGKAVVCEKPFTLDADQAKQVAAIARSSSLFCMEGMWMRFIPLVKELRERVKKGVIGRPVLLSAEFGVPTEFDESNRFFNPNLGGGALLDRGVYLVSLAFWLFGKPDALTATSVSAPTGVDESASIVLKYEDGPMAVLSTSLAARYSNTATVYGELGNIGLSDPFYAAEEMTLALHGGPQRLTNSNSLKARLVGLIKKAPLLGVTARRMRSALGGKIIVRSHGASAYRFEAAEAMRCLRLNLIESPDMPLDETISILECLDEIRGLFRSR